MTSLRDAVYAVAAADTGSGGVVPSLPSGLAGLLGGPTSAPPPAPTTPYLYLQFDAEVPWAPLGPAYEGLFRWRGYDVERAGYVRLRALLLRLRTRYGPYEQMGGSYFLDTATGEDVYWLRFLGLSNETVDETRGLLQLWGDFAYRKVYR